MIRARAGAALLAPLCLLAACDNSAPEPEAEATEIPEEFESEPLPDLSEFEGLGTPMEERVATIGLINKRNNLSRDIEMRPGESQRIDNVIIRLAACERTAPWESPAETGAFVQVFINERRGDDAEPQWYRVHSGWLFLNSPSLNVVEHPVYDVWVKDCAMTFPGEEES